MKKFLLVALLIGIVAISGCVQETPVADEQQQPPAQNQEQETTQTTTTVTPPVQGRTYDPLTSAEMDDIEDKIDDLNSAYNVTEFTSTDDLTFVSIYIYSTYSEIDITKVFKYMRADSFTAEYEVQIVKGMGTTTTDDDVICSYRDNVDNLDEIIDIKWYRWQDTIAHNTCSIL